MLAILGVSNFGKGSAEQFLFAVANHLAKAAIDAEQSLGAGIRLAQSD